MKRYSFLHLLIWTLALSFILVQSWPKKEQGAGVEAFKILPAQQNGRTKPLDSIARTALLSMSGRQSLTLENGQTLGASTWLLILATQPALADSLAIFRVDHPQLRSLIQAEEGKKYLSFDSLLPHFQAIQNAFRQLPEDKNAYSSYEKALEQLHLNLSQYHHLVHSFRPFSESASDTLAEYSAWQALIIPGIQAIQEQSQNKPFDSQILEPFIVLADRYLALSKTPLLGLIPPSHTNHQDEKWANIGQGLLDAIITQRINPIIWSYAELADAAEKKDGPLFGKALDQLSHELASYFPKWRLQLEVLFNQMMPFYQSMGLYIFVFIIITLSWLFKQPNLLRSARSLFILALTLHTIGIVVRMILQGRPPVTSLYASALFVGWAAAFLSLLIERIQKQGLGIAVGSLIGFATLLIAHHLSAGEDTLEQVRAVLDANFWLSTHVVMVTLGYSAMFLAGGIAIFRILQVISSRTIHKEQARKTSNMIYGSLCFALLFSFIGTLLGGIWADQSWGRFWGWDPKENGALLIVLWGAAVLHARIGGLIKQRGLLICALFGNILTSWSWFGTNMLGVGLHSYGFMDAAFVSLLIFILIQLSFMLLCYLTYRTAEKKELTS